MSLRLPIRCGTGDRDPTEEQNREKNSCMGELAALIRIIRHPDIQPGALLGTHFLTRAVTAPDGIKGPGGEKLGVPEGSLGAAVPQGRHAESANRLGGLAKQHLQE